MNDVLINKIQSIQRCVERVHEEYDKNPGTFDTDFTSQDAAVLNILRACEQAIDLANHIIKLGRMGIPNSSVDSFDLIQRKNVISKELAEKLKNMVKFRNLIVHQYEEMDIEIVKSVIQKNLTDLGLYTDQVIAYFRDNPS
ncbi:MAG: DUF86 domain-containing protein [Chloroflexota bacterium]